MRDRYHRAICNGCVPHDDILKIDRTDPFSTRLDQILGAILNSQEPVGINRGYVTGTEPSLAIEGIDGRHFIFKIALNDGVTTDIKLAHRLTVMGQPVSGLIYYFQVDTEHPATVFCFDRYLLIKRQLRHLTGQNTMRPDRAHLGHSPGVAHRDARPFKTFNHRFRGR